MGDPVDSPLGALVIRYTEQRRARGSISSATAKGERYGLWSFCAMFGQRPVKRLAQADVERWLGWMLAEGYTPKTRAQRFRCLRRFCGWLVRHDHIRHDPCADLPPVHVPRTTPQTFEHDEVTALLLAGCRTQRERVVVILCVQLGLRCVEVARMDASDVRRDSVHVRGKAGHERDLPLDGEARTELDRWLRWRGGKPGPLIWDARKPGKGISSKRVTTLVGEIVTRAGVKRHAYDGLTAHGLRRTFATTLLDDGAPIEVVAEGLGHADLSTVQLYARTRPGRLSPYMGQHRFGVAEVIALESPDARTA